MYRVTNLQTLYRTKLKNRKEKKRTHTHNQADTSTFKLLGYAVVRSSVINYAEWRPSRGVHCVQDWLTYLIKSLSIIMKCVGQLFQREYSQYAFILIVQRGDVLRNPEFENSLTCYNKSIPINLVLWLFLPMSTLAAKYTEEVKAQSPIQLKSPFHLSLPSKFLCLCTSPNHMCMCANFWIAFNKLRKS